MCAICVYSVLICKSQIMKVVFGLYQVFIQLSGW